MSKKIFNEKDYNSNDGMLTTVWGPSMWHSLHSISFNYPINPTPKQKRDYMKFILNLKNVLPCGKCRKNLVNNFKRLPLTMASMKSRATFSLYIYELHELINDMLGKKSGLSYDDVRERYEHFRSRCTKSYHELIVMKKKTMKNRSTLNEEKGCTEPLYGDKSKCILKIVPQETKCDTFQIDKSCIKQTL
uniref:thiol oxidase n=1 Tax=viral metagenome TaxID=1070528 RepID=A0A6C0HZ20_9ZZZZ